MSAFPPSAQADPRVLAYVHRCVLTPRPRSLTGPRNPIIPDQPHLHAHIADAESARRPVNNAVPVQRMTAPNRTPLSIST